jgi:hypothetical protein
MTKSISKNKKIKFDPVDFFYETSFKENTVNKIKTIYDDFIYRFPCKDCQTEHVESKIEIKDTYNPIFVIVRKQYCLHCWLKRINS